VQKTHCKIPEQRNLLLGKDPCASLGQFCLFDALNAVRDGLAPEMGGGLISSLFEIEVVVVIRRAGLFVDGHGVLQTVKIEVPRGNSSKNTCISNPEMPLGST